ncbi:HK97 family phage prohead protease [Shouchella clausii]|uniref:HK97 family phage prohead protease n=1 Tax=Shouchella clausii TaxID=79880 RepID=UPI0026F44A98|nr:HK97 family phage prohead protease [Shouchella clausii]MDO7281732.1 HK97 family phage prohead protease [Shouchella clausii]MDO7301827.1 HK97 family phage prohead protease [Shouchella clausii]
MDKNQEIRQLTTKIEVRSLEGEEEKGEYIEGYALKFEKWSERLWYFKEILSRGSLDETDMSNVIACFNHNESYPLARNTASGDTGKLELEVDNIGLKFRFKPTSTSYSKDLVENIRAGIINQCSFSFELDFSDENVDEWRYNEKEDIYERRINKIHRLHDISIVTTPAYSDTEAVVGARSKQKAEELWEARKKPKAELEKMKLELDLLNL